MAETLEPPDDRTPQGRADRLARAAGRAVPILAVVALLFHPTQVTVRQWADAVAGGLGVGASLAARVPSAHVTVSDALFAVAFLVWLALRWADGTLWRRIRSYPLGLIALFVAAALSLILALKCSPVWNPVVLEFGRGAKQIVQIALFFVCAYVVLKDLAGEERWREWLLRAFLAAAAAALLVGLAEYARLRPPSPQAQADGALLSPMGVDATFGFVGEAAGAHEHIGTSSDRNVVSAWLTLVLPLLWAVFLYERRIAVRVVSLVLALIGGALLLHGGLWAAALLGVLVVSLARGRIAFLATAVGMLVFYGLLFRFAPQEPGRALLDSVMLRREADARRTLPLYDIDDELARSGRGADLTKGRYDYPWQQRYMEWQPALLALAQNPLFGVGLGNYQKNINQYYSAKNYFDKDLNCYVYQMPKPAVNLMEQGGNAFYAVWLCETGLVGLIAFLWAMADVLGAGIAGFLSRRSVAGAERAAALKLGACAALGAMLAGCLFTDYWVRGLGVALAFVMALASCDGERQA